MQNAGGCFPPPPGYFQRVREICDEYDVLLVSDEVICAFGRLGYMFGAERYGYQPDIITCAKGITSGYSPLGAMIASDRLMEPFLHGNESFAHGFTFGGHPVSTAVAMANFDVFENEHVLEHVRDNEGAFRSTLERLLDLPIVGDVRGDGYFYGIELVKDKGTRETFNEDESREAAARLPLQGAVRRGPLLPRRRPRRPGHPALSPADLRPDPLRRDGADPAHRPRQGRHPALARRVGARLTRESAQTRPRHPQAARDRGADGRAVGAGLLHGEDAGPNASTTSPEVSRSRRPWPADPA